MALKILREIFTTGTQTGQNIVAYKALAVKTNKTTAMLLISAATYTHRRDIELVMEMTELLSESLSTADWKAFLRTEHYYGRRNSTQ